MSTTRPPGDDLLEMREEIRSLPAQDPLRRDLTDELERRKDSDSVAPSPEDLAAEARLQAELNDVTVPDIDERLFAIAARGGGGGAWSRSILAVAAMLVLMVGAVAGYMITPTPAAADLSALVETAWRVHDGEQVQVWMTDDPAQLVGRLEPELEFSASVPDLSDDATAALDDEVELLGGSTVEIAGHAVLYASWRGARARYSLFQFELTDFGLPAAMERAIIGAPGQSKGGLALWSDHDTGYALVASDRELLAPKQAEPEAPKPASTRDPQLVALKFWHDTCPACREIAPRYEAVKSEFDDAPVLFVELDHTTKLSRLQSKLFANMLGVGDLYDQIFPGTGFVVLIDLNTKQEVGRLTTKHDAKQMTQLLAQNIDRDKFAP